MTHVRIPPDLIDRLDQLPTRVTFRPKPYPKHVEISPELGAEMVAVNDAGRIMGDLTYRSFPFEWEQTVAQHLIDLGPKRVAVAVAYLLIRWTATEHEPAVRAYDYAFKQLVPRMGPQP